MQSFRISPSSHSLNDTFQIPVPLKPAWGANLQGFSSSRDVENALWIPGTQFLTQSSVCDTQRDGRPQVTNTSLWQVAPGVGLEHCLIVATPLLCCDSVVFRILGGAAV